MSSKSQKLSDNGPDLAPSRPSKVRGSLLICWQLLCQSLVDQVSVCGTRAMWHDAAENNVT